MIKQFNWMFKWFNISTEYGEQLVYEPDVFAKAFADNSYQLQLRELLQTDKYDVFLDVGAAWGHFSIIGSKHCKRVIAFEPQPMRYGILLYNCRHLFNVDCRYEFVTCKGEVPRMGGLEQMCESGHTRPYNVKTITLDDIEIHPDEKVMIKVDVEGSEVEVLKGCSNLLANPNVDWFVDIHFCYGVPQEKVLPFFKHKNMRDHGMDNNNAVREFYGNK